MDDDLAIFLQNSSGPGGKAIVFKDVVKEICSANFKKCVFILDCCHSGNPRFGHYNGIEYSAIFATDSGYAFNNYFSISLAECLGAEISKNDRRIDKNKKAVTIKKIFEQTNRIFHKKYPNIQQNPKLLNGDLANLSIAPAPEVNIGSVNEFVSDRTIYRRLFTIVKLVSEGSYESSDLIKNIHNTHNFRIRVSFDGDVYLSQERVQQYIDFLVKVGFLEVLHEKVSLSEHGAAAYRNEKFNQFLLSNIENCVFPDGVSYQSLDEVINILMDNMTSPTFSAIRREFEERHFFLILQPIYD